MNERTVKFKGNPVHLVGNGLKVGDQAPDVELIDTDLKPVKLSSFRGKTVVVIAVPSLDTPVCDMETRKFNEKATKLDESVQMVVVSMDLPFAQSRWCGAHGVKNVKALSDYRDAKFGRASGLLVDEMHLLARAVLVIDPEGKIQYQQLVDDITNEPDYQAVLDAVGKIGATVG
jgi:thiol peroxidase